VLEGKDLLLGGGALLLQTGVVVVTGTNTGKVVAFYFPFSISIGSLWEIGSRKRERERLEVKGVWFGLVWFGLVWFGLVWFGFEECMGIGE
jgi:hypothetical protein